MFNTLALHNAIAAVCPIVGVTVGDPSNRATWVIEFDQSGTTAEQQAAQNVLASFIEPSPPITSFQFMGLFTAAEQLALANSTDTQAKLFVMLATGAGTIDLTNAQVVQGVNYVASIGLITTERAAQVLAGQPPG